MIYCLIDNNIIHEIDMNEGIFINECKSFSFHPGVTISLAVLAKY